MNNDTATAPDDAKPRRTEFGPFVWGHRGNGIDIEASCLMYGVRCFSRFLGLLHKDKPLASSSPVSPYRAEARQLWVKPQQPRFKAVEIFGRWSVQTEMACINGLAAWVTVADCGRDDDPENEMCDLDPQGWAEQIAARLNGE